MGEGRYEGQTVGVGPGIGVQWSKDEGVLDVFIRPGSDSIAWRRAVDAHVLGIFDELLLA